MDIESRIRDRAFSLSGHFHYDDVAQTLGILVLNTVLYSWR